MSVVVEAPRVGEASRLRSMFDLYWTTARLAVQQQIQYRTANYFYMFGMVAEPVIYASTRQRARRPQGRSRGVRETLAYQPTYQTAACPTFAACAR